MPATQSRSYALPASLSPKQQQQQLLQSHVRQSSNDGVHRHRRKPSISLRYNPYEVQNTSNLRLQQRHIRPSPRKAQPVPSALRQLTEEPDFITEEREAWSRRSPRTSLHATIGQKEEYPDFILYDESHLDASDEEDQSYTNTNLKPFAPVLVPTVKHGNYRPKTRRGPDPFHTDVEGDAQLPPSRSKFMEGSMSSRSAGVSSSWSLPETDCEVSSSEAEDSDVTPKANKTRRSSSFDIQEFGPPALSTSAIKKTLFRRRQSHKTDDERPKPKKKERKEKKEKGEGKEGEDGRKKIRKSLSGWNLHSLGEKMGLFNRSSTSIDDSEADELPANSPKPKKSILDERKRRSSEVHPQDFGTKKQKDNTGESHAYMSEPDLPITMRRRTAAADANATIRARNNNQPRRGSLGSTMSRRPSLTDHDARKERSIEQLEKENQQLRSMLKEQQVPPNRTVTRITSTAATTNRPVTRSQCVVLPDQTEQVPPLPILSPQRRPLGDIANTCNTAPSPKMTAEQQAKVLTVDHLILRPTPPSHASNTSTVLKRRSLSALPRGVSMIIEEPEMENEDLIMKKIEPLRPKTKFVVKNTRLRTKQSLVEKENGLLVSTETAPGPEQVVAQKLEWDGWDEDVF